MNWISTKLFPNLAKQMILLQEFRNHFVDVFLPVSVPGDNSPDFCAGNAAIDVDFPDREFVFSEQDQHVIVARKHDGIVWHSLSEFSHPDCIAFGIRDSNKLAIFYLELSQSSFYHLISFRISEWVVPAFFLACPDKD